MSFCSALMLEWQLFCFRWPKAAGPQSASSSYAGQPERMTATGEVIGDREWQLCRRLLTIVVGRS